MEEEPTEGTDRPQPHAAVSTAAVSRAAVSRAAVSHAAVRWNIAALLLAVLTAVLVTLVPLGSSGTDTVTVATGTSGAETTTSRSHTSLLESEGYGVLIVAFVPALLAAVPLAARTQRLRRRSSVVSSALIGVFVLLGAASIGLAFVPTLLAMIAATQFTRASPEVPQTALR